MSQTCQTCCYVLVETPIFGKVKSDMATLKNSKRILDLTLKFKILAVLKVLKVLKVLTILKALKVLKILKILKILKVLKELAVLQYYKYDSFRVWLPTSLQCKCRI